nr:ribonuclease H-like domain-containing protein [Tanacetum cinerariifolium]
MARSFKKSNYDAMEKLVIIAVSSCKVSLYGSTLQLSATTATHNYLNPDIPDLEEYLSYCPGKLIDGDDIPQCLDHGAQPNHVYRYIFKAAISDGTATSRSTFFTPNANVLTKLDYTHLVKLHNIPSASDFLPEILNLAGQNHIFQFHYSPSYEKGNVEFYFDDILDKPLQITSGSKQEPDVPEWDKQDDLVKVWILGTLEESLQEQVVTTPGNAKALKYYPITTEPPYTHRMVTRSQSVIVKPIDRLSLHTTYISSLPKSLFLALQNPNWNNDMHDEYNALVKNDTWILVPRPAGINLVPSMWLSKHKFHADGTLSCYKARLVANGSSQQHGIDCDETFSPVVKPATIRTVLSLAVSRKWPIHQLDVKNAFLSGDLSETVYMHQPPGFVDPRDLQVMPLMLDFTTAVVTLPYSFFVRDLSEFDMTDLGALNYFLGISATRHSTGLFLSQKQYAIELLAHAHMTNCNPSRTLVDTDTKLGPEDLSIYYATFEELWILDFTCTLLLPSLLLGTQMRIGQATPQQGGLIQVTVFFLGDNLLSWSSKRQQTISRSSAKAEYRGVANVVAETAWLRNLLRELHSPLSAATLVYCENVSATYLSANPVQHQRTKHIEIDIHFVRDLVTAG